MPEWAPDERWHTHARQGAADIVLIDGYFNDMSLADWIGFALLAPLLLLMGVLFVYLLIGVIGSGPRRRRIANQPPAEQPDEATPSPVHGETPDD